MLVRARGVGRPMPPRSWFHRVTSPCDGEFVVGVRTATRPADWALMAFGHVVGQELTTAIEAADLRRRGYPEASGAIAFKLMLQAASGAGPIAAIQGVWMTTSDNLRSFHASIASGATPPAAATMTWTGRQAGQSGYTEANVKISTAHRVIVQFTRPP